MPDSPELTDDEIVREIERWWAGKRYRNPLRGLTRDQVLHIERSALAKIRRQMGSAALQHFRATRASEASPAVYRGPSVSRFNPEAPPSDWLTTDFEAFSFPGLCAGTIQAQGRGNPIRRTRPGKS